MRQTVSPSAVVGSFLALYLIALCEFGGFARAAPAEGPQTGVFTTSFAERSPLTSAKLLAERLSSPTEFGPDYDLTKEQFLLVVPDDYNGTRPWGVVVLLNDKETTEPPEPVLPILKERRLLFVAPEGVGQPAWVRCGLAVDAVHNLSKSYAVDPIRIYLFDMAGGAAGQYAALAFPDVFTGSFHADGMMGWLPDGAPPQRDADAQRIAPPPAKYVDAAGAHPLVVSHATGDAARTAADESVLRKGFRYVKRMTVSAEQVRYPHYEPTWFAAALAFLDANAPRPAATRPATAPATEPADVGGAAASPSAATVPTTQLGSTGPSLGNSRRVIFICDASGLSDEQLALMKAYVGKAVESLKPINTFNVILFRDGKPVALDATLSLAATRDNRWEAGKFIEGMKSRGDAVDAGPALELAFAQKPEVVYLLTHRGFLNAKTVAEKLRQLNRDLTVRVHAIACLDDPSVKDAEAMVDGPLKVVADENHGKFRRATESDMKE